MTTERGRALAYIPAQTQGTALSGRLLERLDGVSRELSVRRPDRRRPDQQGWLGKPRLSRALQEHEARLDATDYASEEAEFAFMRGLALEYQVVSGTAVTVKAQVGILEGLEHASPERVVVENIFLESADRISRMADEAAEYFRQRALK